MKDFTPSQVEELKKRCQEIEKRAEQADGMPLDSWVDLVKDAYILCRELYGENGEICVGSDEFYVGFNEICPACESSRVIHKTSKMYSLSICNISCPDSFIDYCEQDYWDFRTGAPEALMQLLSSAGLTFDVYEIVNSDYSYEYCDYYNDCDFRTENCKYDGGYDDEYDEEKDED